nr:hypothetical protein [Candidatus Omnitrophota bacterium]
MIESTPEEKLLNLIKKGQSKVRFGKDLKIFTKVNMILISLIAVITVVFLADIFIFKKDPSLEPVIVGTQQTKAPQALQMQPAAAEKIEEDSVMDHASLDKNINIKKISKEEILGNLNLLGIITGDNNQAIIEDKTLKKTFFLYKGDLFGELKVYDIRDSVVILEYKGEKIELNI